MQKIARKLVLLTGDWAGLYLALFLMLISRYGPDWELNWALHIRPFSLVFPIWIITLAGAYLYETRFIRMSLDTVRAIITAISIAMIASITAFYAFPPGLISPRRNMVIFAVIYGAVLLIWRWLFYRASRNKIKTKLVFIGDGIEADELAKHFKENPHIGFEVADILKSFPDDPNKLCERIKNEDIRLLVIKEPNEAQKIKNL